VLVVSEVLDGSKAAEDPGIFIQVVHNAPAHVQVVRVSRGLHTTEETAGALGRLVSSAVSHLHWSELARAPDRQNGTGPCR